MMGTFYNILLISVIGAKSMENPTGIDFTTIENSPEVEFLQKVQEKM